MESKLCRSIVMATNLWRAFAVYVYRPVLGALVPRAGLAMVLERRRASLSELPLDGKNTRVLSANL